MIKNISQLTEVKKGQAGTGLLLERDAGHIMGNVDVINQIKEDIEHHKEFVIPDKFTVSAVFQKYGIKNANGRVYPEAILKPAVEKYIQERVMTRSAIGALDHPSETTLSGHDVTHNITNLEWRGHTLIGEMDLHLSPAYRKYGAIFTSGDAVANLIIDGILVGVSSRGVGTVTQRLGVLEVEDDFDLICWDVVMENSTPGAKIAMSREELLPYMESDENKIQKPRINEKLERIKNILY